MGWTGAFTQITTSIAHLQKGVMIFAGFVVIVMALAMNGWLPLGSIFGDGYVPLGTISRVFRKLVVSQSSLTYYLLGLLLGLLPCGPVYTALVAAARLGMDASDTVRGFLSGMGVMLAFGIGTVPAVAMVARLTDLGWLKSRKKIYRISALLMVLVGIYFVVNGIRY
jgi:sulfite exporter TauE/SafE